MLGNEDPVRLSGMWCFCLDPLRWGPILVSLVYAQYFLKSSCAEQSGILIAGLVSGQNSEALKVQKFFSVVFRPGPLKPELLDSTAHSGQSLAVQA